MRKLGLFLALLASPLLIGEFNSAMAASKRAQPVVTQQSTWNHNGSIVTLIAQGDKHKIVYENPRVGLLDAGVTQGMVLFEGQRKRSAISGTAYMFYRTCKPQAYPVSGDINDNATQITLRGKAPLLDLHCNSTGSREDLLIFTAVQTPGEPPKSEQIAAAPSQTPPPAKTPPLSEAAKAANASAAPVVSAGGEKRGAVPTDGAVDALATAKKSEDAKAKTEGPAAGSVSAAKEPPSAEPPKAAAAAEPKTEKIETPPGSPTKDEKNQAANTTQLASLPQDNANAAPAAPAKSTAQAKDSAKTGAGIDKGADAEKQRPQPPAAEAAPAAPPAEQKDIKTAAIPPPAPPAETKSDDAGKSKDTAADKTPAASTKTPPATSNSPAASGDGKTSPLMTGQEKMMEIVLRNGRILRVGRDMDIEALSRLIAMLERQ